MFIGMQHITIRGEKVVAEIDRCSLCTEGNCDLSALVGAMVRLNKPIFGIRRARSIKIPDSIDGKAITTQKAGGQLLESISLSCSGKQSDSRFRQTTATLGSDHNCGHAKITDVSST